MIYGRYEDRTWIKKSRNSPKTDQCHREIKKDTRASDDCRAEKPSCSLTDRFAHKSLTCSEERKGPGCGEICIYHVGGSA